ncbi:cyclodeaminase/cyclohydrolase family protein [Aminiphilus sp.]|uniref:cyclodeaminase/cyclohydrolase family protein n=1 Tax=Aminiphilus sp. TaxID=1872488 RepID=UPI002603DAF9|nr:cyclodeaminase/cyclohydrolase family protein [Aminiphilus sp.]
MKLSEHTLRAFIHELASDSPAPGGGSVAALAAALGAALTAMVARLTVGKEKYRSAWEAMENVRAESDALQERLLELMEEDTEAFNAFMAAMKLPKETDEEKAARAEAMQKATRGAIDVPLRTLRCCVSVVALAEKTCAQGNSNAITDAGSAAVLARAAAAAAAYNVRINLGSLKDASFAAQTDAETASLLEEVERRATAVENAVLKALR